MSEWPRDDLAHDRTSAHTFGEAADVSPDLLATIANGNGASILSPRALARYALDAVARAEKAEARIEAALAELYDAEWVAAARCARAAAILRGEA